MRNLNRALAASLIKCIIKSDSSELGTIFVCVLPKDNKVGSKYADNYAFILFIVLANIETVNNNAIQYYFYCLHCFHTIDYSLQGA